MALHIELQIDIDSYTREEGLFDSEPALPSIIGCKTIFAFNFFLIVSGFARPYLNDTLPGLSGAPDFVCGYHPLLSALYSTLLTTSVFTGQENPILSILR